MPEKQSERRPPIPKGTYRAKPVSMDWRKSQNKGTKFVNVALSIVGGDYDGRIVSWQGYMTENTWERTVESLQFMGFKGTDLKNLEGCDREVSIVVEHEEYDGKTYARVAWVNSLGANFGAPMGDDELAGFAEKMKGRLQAKGMGGGASEGDTPPPIDDDDIPF